MIWVATAVIAVAIISLLRYNIRVRRQTRRLEELARTMPPPPHSIDEWSQRARASLARSQNRRSNNNRRPK